MFRANLNIRTNVPYEEDKIAETRVNNIFFKLVQPVIRCKAVNYSYENKSYDPNSEPLRTLGEYRRNKPMGSLFGTYIQNFTMHKEEDFKFLLPTKEVPKDRFHPKYGIIRPGDKMHVIREQDAPDFVK